MQIGLNDIDPQIAAQMEERLTAPLHQYLKDDIFFPLTTHYGIPGFMRGSNERDASEVERRAFEYRLERDNVSSNIARARFLSFALAAIAGTIVASIAPVMGILFALFTWLIVLQTSTQSIVMNRPVEEVHRHLSQEEIQAVIPLMKLSFFERIYANTLLWLASQDHYADENALRLTLHELNSLLANGRGLEEQRKQIEAAIKKDKVIDLEAQEATLRLQLARESDPVVRRALEQSIGLCETRLQNARSLITSLKRLDAQKELIQQTFALVQSSLTHSHISPVQSDVPYVNHIQQNVNDMAHSVEKSVQEMILLRSE